MEYLKKIFALTLSIFCFISCEKEEYEEPLTISEKAGKETLDNPIINKISEMGFQVSSIEEYPDFYLVEGDIIFSKNNDFIGN